MSRPAQLRSLLLITLVASALFQGCRSEEPAPRVEQPPLPAPSRIFLITVDTLRADHLGAYGYPRDTSPHIDRLAEEGVLFRRAIAQWPKTTPSFGAIFTGQYPQTNGMTHRAARGLYDSFLTMAEMFQGAGYFTAAVISNPVLRKSLGWDQGFDRYWQSWRTDEDLGSDAVRYREVINAQRVNSMAPYLLERVAAHERFFVWIHYSDPHAPYILPAATPNPFLGDELDVGDARIPDDLSAKLRLDDETRLGFYIAQYDANILEADRAIGEILQIAEERGLLADALVVIASDHGEEMGEHESYFRHGPLPYNTGSHVPLIFYYPGAIAGGRIVDRPVELIDLYPTFAELVGGESPAQIEGSSLLPLLRETPAQIEPEEPAYAFSEAGQPLTVRHYYRSIQDDRWKLVYHPATSGEMGEAPVLLELYDLESDPLELADLAGQHKGEFDRLWGELSEWIREGESPSAAMEEGEGLDEETQDALRALGYLD
jgi:arylsulfatase A-like enzyme